MIRAGAKAEPKGTKRGSPAASAAATQGEELQPAAGWGQGSLAGAKTPHCGYQGIVLMCLFQHLGCPSWLSSFPLCLSLFTPTSPNTARALSTPRKLI